MGVYIDHDHERHLATLEDGWRIHQVQFVRCRRREEIGRSAGFTAARGSVLLRLASLRDLPEAIMRHEGRVTRSMWPFRYSAHEARNTCVTTVAARLVGARPDGWSLYEVAWDMPRSLEPGRLLSGYELRRDGVVLRVHRGDAPARSAAHIEWDLRHHEEQGPLPDMLLGKREARRLAEAARSGPLPGDLEPRANAHVREPGPVAAAPRPPRGRHCARRGHAAARVRTPPARAIW